MSFNASVEVTEVVMRTLENASKELAKRCILECALRHNFDGDEELRILGLENVTVILKKKPVIKEKPVIPSKAKFCLPFLSSSVDKNGCNGIAFNEGLFTQCKKVRIENESFCKMCLGESKVSENGEPKNGTVQRRSESPYYSYQDSRGRMPLAYLDYMKKRDITEDEVLSEAEKQGLTIPREHFMSFSRSKKSVAKVAKVVKKSKKSLIFEEDEEKEDLFAQVNDMLEETLEDLSNDLNNVVLDDYSKAQKEEEKRLEREAKALEKALEKANQKAEREAKAAQDKAEREEKLALEKAEKAAEREAKKAQEKAAREEKLALEKIEREAKLAQKAQEKAEKEAKAELEKAEKAAKLAQEKAEAKAAREAKLAEEKAARETKLAEEKAAREAKVAQEKADREAKKAQEKEEKEAKKPTQKTQKTVEKPVEKPMEKPAETTAPKKVTVKRLFYNGKQYLKSTENMLYDPDTREEVGIWCEETQTILDLPDEYYESDEDEDEN